MNIVDLDKTEVRELNASLHDIDASAKAPQYKVINSKGKHNLAVGLDAEVDVIIDGHVGYYCGGMNKHADITVTGNAGPGLGENIMSGTIRVKGSTSQYTAATGVGGLVVIEGDAAARCGISMKGVDIVVGGSIGHMSAFMGQAGNLIVCGDAGDSLGDSIYEVHIFVQGKVKSLGHDCEEKEMRKEHLDKLAELLEKAGFDAKPKNFKRYGPARKLYNFKVDDACLP